MKEIEAFGIYDISSKFTLLLFVAGEPEKIPDKVAIYLSLYEDLSHYTHELSLDFPLPSARPIVLLVEKYPEAFTENVVSTVLSAALGKAGYEGAFKEEAIESVDWLSLEVKYMIIDETGEEIYYPKETEFQKLYTSISCR